MNEISRRPQPTGSTGSVARYFRYPEEVREEFIQTDDIEFRDGSRVTAAEVWEYLTKVGPVKYPVLYDDSDNFFGRLSRDFTLPANLKGAYLQMTLHDRMTKARAQGHPIVFVQGGQPFDAYYAAGAVALRPALVGQWARRQREGLTRNQDLVESAAAKQKAYHAISFEICNSGGYEHIQEGDVPVDLVAPITTLRCSDVPYGAEAHRHGPRKDDVELLIVDYPLGDQKNKEWAIQYFADNLRRLVKKIDSLTGRTTTEDDLALTIKRHNEGRRLAQEIAELWWSAEHPPTNGQDRAFLALLGLLDFHGDPVASLSVLREAKRSIERRVQQGHDVIQLVVIGPADVQDKVEHRLHHGSGRGDVNIRVATGIDNHIEVQVLQEVDLFDPHALKVIGGGEIDMDVIYCKIAEVAERNAPVKGLAQGRHDVDTRTHRQRMRQSREHDPHAQQGNR